MKKLFTIILVLVSFSLTAQKKNTGYFYLAPGYFGGQNNSNFFYPSIGMGVRNSMASIGAAFYYSKSFRMSAHFDFRMYLENKGKSGPFIFLQPGKLFYTNSYSNIKNEGGFDFKGGVGFMTKDTKKTPGIYFSIGYSSFVINTTVLTKVNSSVVKGAIVSAGVKF